MERFLRMVEFARTRKARGMVLRGAVSPILLTVRGRQPLNKVTSTQEVDELLSTLTPPALAGRLADGVPLRFAVETPGGPVTVLAALVDGRPEVTVLLNEASDPTPPVAFVLPAPGTPAVHGAARLAPAVPAAPPLEVAAPTPIAGPLPPPLPEPPPTVDVPPDYLPGLFAAALAASASDVYLQPGARPWGRVRGDVQPFDYGRTLAPDELKAVLFDLTPPDARGRWVEHGTAEFCVPVGDRARVRCTLFAGVDGVSASFRFLPPRPPTLAELQAPSAVVDLARAERGLVVVAGLRAAGVTSTLAAIVDTINKERRARIVCVEAPVEFLHRPERALVAQVDVPGQAPTFAEALRRLARADADACLVSDLSSPDTLKEALALAEGGTLVFGGLRLADVPAVVERLVEAAGGHPPAAERVARCLRGVVCRRLCRPARPGPLVPLYEVLTVSPTAAALVRQGKYRELHGAMFVTFDAALAGCVKEGRVTRDEALRQASDPETLRRLLH